MSDSRQPKRRCKKAEIVDFNDHASPDLYRLLARKLGSPDEAREVAHDAFEKLLRQVEREEIRTCSGSSLLWQTAWRLMCCVAAKCRVGFCGSSQLMIMRHNSEAPLRLHADQNWITEPFPQHKTAVAKNGCRILNIDSIFSQCRKQIVRHPGDFAHPLRPSSTGFFAQRRFQRRRSAASVYVFGRAPRGLDRGRRLEH